MSHCKNCLSYISVDEAIRISEHDNPACPGCGHEAELALLSDEREYVSAIKSAIVDTVGGTDDEGNPTSEINYLQRLRRLVKAEQELALLRAVAETVHAYSVYCRREDQEGETIQAMWNIVEDALAAWEKIR